MLRLGSPPRVRGKLHFRLLNSCCKRITPARAGKTLTLRRNACTPKDHPRACGENTDLLTFWATRVGSPPRVRGKPPMFLITLHLARITPARAGKTFFDGTGYDTD